MSDVWKNIIIVIVSSLLAVLAQQYFYEKQNEIQKIDINTKFDSNYLYRPKFPDSKVEIKVNGKAKDSIGILEVSLVNFTNNVYKDVPVLIEIKPKSNNSFNYLSHFAYGEKGIKELVLETKNHEIDNSTGIQRFFYNVKSLNRSEEAEYGMKLGILFEGHEKPDVVVSIIGLGTRDFDIQHSPARTAIKRDAFFTLITIVVGAIIFAFTVFSPLMSRLLSPLDRRSDKRYAQQLFDVLRNYSEYNELSDEQLKTHISDFLHKQRIIWWNKKSWLTKWSFGMRAPDPSDYLI